VPKKAHIVFFANALNNINFEKNDKINMSLFQNSVLNKYLKGLESEKVNEAYERFTTHFHNSTIQENIRNSKEEQYQGEFLIDLFVNVFGYVKNPTPDFNLTTELKNIKGSKKTDGAILKGEKALAVIELKGTNTTDLGKVETQAFGYKNNQPGCNYVITSNFEKLRFYIDNAVDFEEFNLFQLTKERFETLWLCLSSEYLLKDIPKKIKDESLTQEENITKKLYKDYASFRNEIFDSIQNENPEYDKLTLFKKTQKLLDRFLFIFFAEDRLLLPPNSIRSIVNQWTDLRDKYDEYFPLYDRFQKYFGYMNTGHKGQQHDIFAYNGGLFAPDEILDNIKINDDLLYKHTVNLSNYDFESEVSVNILGHIFEHSLNDIDEIQAEIQGVVTEQTKTKRKKDGVFYTPKYVTKYIVDNTVGKLCEEKKTELDIQETEYEKERKGRKKATLKNLTQKLEDYRKWLLQITICDPACGSGAFLNQALEFLITEHKYIDELQAKLFGDAMILSEVENSILENNLFGVDINDESVEIAKLSLWLRTAQKGRKLTSLNNNIKCGNSIVNDKNVAKDKAFDWQSEFPKVFSKGGFDVVIGNPPYGAYLEQEDKNFLSKEFETFQGNFEIYFFFIELLNTLSNENGISG
jgi:type I restriction-modification system DNA methylase subunit